MFACVRVCVRCPCVQGEEFVIKLASEDVVVRSHVVGPFDMIVGE